MSPPTKKGSLARLFGNVDLEMAEGGLQLGWLAQPLACGGYSAPLPREVEHFVEVSSLTSDDHRSALY